MSRFFLPSMALMMICFIGPTLCRQQDEEEKGFWMRSAVHVVNNLPDPMRVRCQSKDDDLGLQTLQPRQDLTWRFVPNVFIDNTLFYCHFYWGSKDKFFDVYNHDMGSHCSILHSKDKSCYWSVRSDGF
ncbi:S-protein homolog 4-like [Diospyros lotus]|uniref:S-protein homolog 4-like n=1 Tax=Diospyros lotus TaxID=55363 RepID=UPI00224C85F8|nr:S-protein homolog 4-like [Diospyros lotus]XP_052180224.1 S-protein homolog 4-like [Diospyros lotus]